MDDSSEVDDTALFPDKQKYISAIGCLLYLAWTTRAELAYAVSVVASKNQNPTMKDWMKVKRIFRYLKGSSDQGIEFQSGSNTGIEVYADASFNVGPGERKSRSGYAIFFNGNLVSWYSKKQPGLPALSTVEAEFRSATQAIPEGLWLRNLCLEITKSFDNRVEINPGITLLEDNQGAIAAMKNPVQFSKLRHIDLKHCFIRDTVRQGLVKVLYCESKKMIADVFTKALDQYKFCGFRNNLGIR
jgi:hypothetical protein